jgi:N-acetylmuramoyl-L-alanine amidase
MSKSIKVLVIHSTSTPEGRILSSDDIRRIHCTSVSEGGKGWPEVGFSDLIHYDGHVERLVKNPSDAYVDGWNVDNARHIAYMGGIARNGRTVKDTRTDHQKKSIDAFIKRFKGIEIVYV